MGEAVGQIKVVVVRGKKLVIRDLKSSDPYVILKLGNQEVFDKDRFKADDKMGHARISLQPLIAAARLKQILQVSGSEKGMTLRKVIPESDNCLAGESTIISGNNNEVIQDVWLRLCEVESGEIEIKIKVVKLPSSPVASTTAKMS
ncbi:OLC1v1021101C4 [Oldenlandia corymbosa var. corymbosa]|uniref:OLC1v1021101C4 n=1 Tax=Oldenlandia corymbosa var. corymbosa TaxID=529605 RepID=A0AAV1BV77_OLDCO|nr:OLC1v1021101C4 [Oldenlandia corymbosa var. corymbosa]